MITFRRFALRRGSRLLLSSMDLSIQPGWRLGVVGRNGCGKSSLFAALQGQLEADAGELGCPASWRVAAVAQETPALSTSAIDYVLSGDAALWGALCAQQQAQQQNDMQAMAEAYQRIEALQAYDAQARAGRLLHGLGFTAQTHQHAVRDFSGGWRVRLNLARALMAPSELLLLDEPTNHLDLDAVVWLEAWLRRYQGTLLVISHDREFLDSVVTHTLHLHEACGKLYTGNYSAFERLRAEQLRQQQLAYTHEQSERARLQSFIDRFKAKASKAKQAQARIKRLEKLAGTEAVRAERLFRFSFAAPDRLPHSLVQLDHVNAGYPAATTDHTPLEVLHTLCFHLEAGERIGLLGPNGAGKSTLIKTLAGELAPLGGVYHIHKEAQLGYFAQHTVESLRAGASPFDHLQDKAPHLGAQVLRDFLGSWHFAGERAFESVDNFSGGERARLALALIAWDRPNVLLLDEPTNHLDLDMREALAEALTTYEGAVVLVSHDRYLLSLVCDGFYRVADGVVARFDGDLEDYARWLRSRHSGAKKRQPAAVAMAAPQPVAAGPASAGRTPATSHQAKKTARQRLKNIESRTAAIDNALAELEAQLADPAFYRNPSADLVQLGQRQAALRHEKEHLEDEWLSVYAQWEA